MYAELTLDELKAILQGNKSEIVVTENTKKATKYLSIMRDGKSMRVLFKNVQLKIAFWNNKEYMGNPPKYDMVMLAQNERASSLQNEWAKCILEFGKHIMKMSKSTIEFTKIYDNNGPKEETSISFKIQLNTERDSKCRDLIIKVECDEDEYMHAKETGTLRNLKTTILSRPSNNIVMYKNNLYQAVPSGSIFIGDISAYIGSYELDGAPKSRLFLRTMDQIVYLCNTPRIVVNDDKFLEEFGLDTKPEEKIQNNEPETNEKIQDDDLDILKSKVGDTN